ncbi:hypothetical protein [Rhizobium rhizosphaerae]|nr:hypothetical protein [Xaviernesmea rhizosphaerae]
MAESVNARQSGQAMRMERTKAQNYSRDSDDPADWEKPETEFENTQGKLL